MIARQSDTVPPSVAPAPPPTPDPAPIRRFWLCADDYGLSPAVGRAIRDLIARRRLNAVSVMVVAPNFSAAEAEALLALASAERRVALGLHFTLTAPFRPLAGGYRPRSRDGAFPNLRRMLAAGLLGVLDAPSLGAESERQLAAFRSAFGRPPDFVDGHQHVHLLPQVADALLAAMKTAAPRALVRQCGRAPALRGRWTDPKGLLLDGLSRGFRARSAKAGFSTNPAFAGTYTYRPQADYGAVFAAFLESLPDGGLVMCHPGFVDPELQRLDSLTALREREYSFFAGDSFPRLLARHGLALA
jgi:predicted glycoside hydrolase/deacetylase ChbG (UPF0249 family)